ncbi:hypothetical protein AMTRI_Chr10g2710 [Amborella trichopoda]|uniref:Uncharacterized protein n=1 Tax=Amborella trichopoda TaxID=13333 RepID=U5DBG2_AMBTC|nr:uncharacterized protein LOC18446078 [Amborella trichopoda]ERN17748.1 hypothetical protein AMTR_s00047p00083900 [Amborella trichopoda]|eukprot:XP_011627789.1 uncharacterized protein LOC18446078 [Amborella trichopoda]
MEISEMLLKYKYHAIYASLVFLSLLSLVLVAPKFLTILKFFWPLLVSTGLFLVAIIFFGKTASWEMGSSERGGEFSDGLESESREGFVGTSEGSVNSSNGVLESAAEQHEGGVSVFNSIMGFMGHKEEDAGSRRERKQKKSL